MYRFMLVLALAVELVTSAEGQCWPPGASVQPPQPTTQDQVTITLGGEWSNSCIPNVSYAVVVGDTINFGVIHAYPPDVVCLMVMTWWSRSETIGPLPDGTYVVEATLYHWTEPVAGPTPVHSFTVVAPGPSVVPLDIRPGACPNWLDRNSHGVLPVALVGTENFDVTEIDRSSVLLSRADGVGGEVAPNEGPPGPHTVIEDVATPFDGEPCDCHELEGGGILHLSMKFRTDDLVAELELDALNPGDDIKLVVSGSLIDGTEFTSSGDCILIVPPGPANLAVTSNAADVYVDVVPADLTVDGGGFPAFERSYDPGTVVTLTAAATADGRSFRAWKINGVLWTTGQTVIDVTMIESMTARALYCSQTIKDPGLGVYQGSPTPFER